MARTSRAKAATACCLFCGRPWTPGIVRKSKEHPLGDWIKQREENHPAEHTSYSTGFLLGEDHSELVQVRPEITHKKAPLLTVHTREVCEDCNNGWMSAMEKTAKPVILQMAQAAQSGIAIAVSREHARELAVWAQKTALAYELTSDTEHVGTVAMGQEVRAGRPVRGSQVWAARNTRDSDMGVALAQIDISATPIPSRDDRPPGPDGGDRLPPHNHAGPYRRLARADMATALPSEMDAAMALIRRSRVPPDERHHHRRGPFLTAVSA